MWILATSVYYYYKTEEFVWTVITRALPVLNNIGDASGRLDTGT